MSDNNINWGIIIAVVIVVSILASFATVKLTGNVISVAKGVAGKVYTTSEIDAKLNSVNQGVLDMLDKKCAVWSVAVPNATRQVTGDEICKERNAGTCVLMINYDRFSSNDMIQKCTPYITGKSDETVAYCCTP